MAASAVATKEAASGCEELKSEEPTAKKQKICDCQELKLPQDISHAANDQGVPDAPDYSSDCYSGDEYDAYYKSVSDSRGYDVIDFPRTGSVLSTVLPVDQSGLEEHYEFYKSYAQFAVDENNQKKKTNYELEKVVKVNILMARGASYYFTLKVKNKDDAQQTSCICRALVYLGIDDSVNLLEFYEDHEYQVVECYVPKSGMRPAEEPSGGEAKRGFAMEHFI